MEPRDQTEHRSIDVLDGYDKWSLTYDHDPNPLIAVEEGVVPELMGNVAGLRVLDLGCGTGRYGLRLARQGARVAGVDMSPGMLAQARRRNAPVCFDVVQGAKISRWPSSGNWCSKDRVDGRFLTDESHDFT